MTQADNFPIGSLWLFSRTGVIVEIVRHRHKQSRTEVGSRQNYLYLVVRDDEGNQSIHTPGELCQNTTKVETVNRLL